MTWTNITNGTKPDADEVMGNFNLLKHAKGNYVLVDIQTSTGSISLSSDSDRTGIIVHAWAYQTNNNNAVYDVNDGSSNIITLNITSSTNQVPHSIYKSTSTSAVTFTGVNTSGSPTGFFAVYIKKG